MAEGRKPVRRTAPKTKMRTLEIEYRVGIRRNIGDFSSAMVEASEREIHDVSDLPDDAIDLFEAARYEAIRTRLDGRIEAQDRAFRGVPESQPNDEEDEDD